MASAAHRTAGRCAGRGEWREPKLHLSPPGPTDSCTAAAAALAAAHTDPANAPKLHAARPKPIDSWTAAAAPPAAAHTGPANVPTPHAPALGHTDSCTAAAAAPAAAHTGRARVAHTTLAEGPRTPTPVVLQHSSGLCVEVLRAGDASVIPRDGDTVGVHYACLLAATASCVDSSRSKPCTSREPMQITLGKGQVVAGMELGLKMLSLGAFARLHLPANLGYADAAAGAVPAGSALVFEVEVLQVNHAVADALPPVERRRLLLLPTCGPLGRAPLAPCPPAAPGEVPVPGGADGLPAGEGSSRPPASSSPSSAASSTGAAAFEGDGLSAWLLRLKPTGSPRPPEVASFVDFYKEKLRTADAAAAAASAADHGASLLPGARPIGRAVYGTQWDSRSPLVLTGERDDWAPSEWGWEVLDRRFGDAMVMCKQRAPIFDSDRASLTLVAESTLREYIQYARQLRVGEEFEPDTLPVMYMNGWDVFEAFPSCWADGVDCIPGTIRNLSEGEYARLHRQFGLGDALSKVRSLCKLFVGPVGAVTRMHQDNHHAHAWLSQLEGYKLYVLCSPEQSDHIEPRGCGAADGGTTREGLLDPLDPQQRCLPQYAGATLFATVLAPGETILAPDGWWHYAASLTPTVTLMCNFWDEANVHSLRQYFMETTARALDTVRRRAAARAAQGRGPSIPTAQAGAASPTVVFDCSCRYLVRHAPFVYLRAAPSTEAAVLGVLLVGAIVEVGASRDGWLRAESPVVKGQFGWLLEDGNALGLGLLLTRV